MTNDLKASLIAQSSQFSLDFLDNLPPNPYQFHFPHRLPSKYFTKSFVKGYLEPYLGLSYCQRCGIFSNFL